jgi:serine/threonine protein kinase
MSGCPDLRDLEQFLNDELGPERGRAVDTHISECPACDAIVRGLAMRRTDAGAAAVTVLLAARADAAPAVPGYRMLQELGAGGMGVVWRAEQVALKRVVALKMIRPALVGSPQGQARFLTEAEAAARLSHPNIVPVYERGVSEHGPYF